MTGRFLALAESEFFYSCSLCESIATAGELANHIRWHKKHGTWAGLITFTLLDGVDV